MPGLTNNETILSSDNQLILTQNEQTTALNSIKSAIDDITEQLAAIKSQMATCCNGGADLIGVPVDQLTPLQLDKRCKAMNYIFDCVYRLCVEMEAQNVDQFGSLGAALTTGIATIVIAAALDGPAPFGDILGVVIGAIVFLLTAQADLNDIIDGLETNRNAIISDLYAATNNEEARNAFYANMTLQGPERTLLGMLLVADLLKIAYVDNFEVPAGYTATTQCAEFTGDCVNEYLRPVVTSWQKGTPSLLSGGNFVSGNVTGQWDYTVYLVVFLAMDDPIPVMTINSITTPSVDMFVECCNGTIYDQNEVLSSAFPMTFYNVVYVSAGRTSSNFTMSITF